MKDKVITIKPKGITQKQCANLLLELNLVKKSWKPYGVDMQINAPGLKNIEARENNENNVSNVYMFCSSTKLYTTYNFSRTF